MTRCWHIGSSRTLEDGYMVTSCLSCGDELERHPLFVPAKRPSAESGDSPDRPNVTYRYVTLPPESRDLAAFQIVPEIRDEADA